ncbi:MAG: ATP-grasp domain-containing protein [Planctomycetaceae bacterium]
MPVDRASPVCNLLIVGASARAAAHSAIRGGLQPLCVDLFGDVDLRAIAPVIVVDDFSEPLNPAFDALQPVRWMYTGALENHPRLIARLNGDPVDCKAPLAEPPAQKPSVIAEPLLGNGPRALARVRNPWWLADTLRATGLPALDVWPVESSPPPADGCWLLKPLQSGGGRGIEVWNGAARDEVERAKRYFQRRAEGVPYSAQFLALPEQTVLLGITRQLVGVPAVGAPEFAWCGALTLASMPLRVEETMCRIGEQIAAAGGLQGLFGCDFVVSAGVPWLTEVNPRYTAAMELLDYALHTSLVAWHVRACTGEIAGVSDLAAHISNLRLQEPTRRGVSGKVVLFAESDLVVGDATELLRDPCDDRLPLAADLPAPGSRLPRGWPVCTLFAEGSNEEACLEKLLARAASFRTRYLRQP